MNTMPFRLRSPAGNQCSRHNAMLVEVAFFRCRGAETIALIRHRHMQRILVCFRIHRDRRNAHFLARPDDAHSNFTPVCNENL